MVFIYDNTFMGLLTVIFKGYKNLEDCKIILEDDLTPFFEDVLKIETDRKLANRVKKGIVEQFGNNFFYSIQLAFRSFEKNKDEIIIKTVKGLYKNGPKYLHSSEKVAVSFNKIVKNVLSENHDYKGLLRFQEIEDGFFYARFRPKNDILDIIFPHFKKRMPNEKFIIHDVGRRLCIIFEDGLYDYMEMEEFEFSESEGEIYFSQAWKKFYNSIKIKERENKKLMISNMPKYRWEFLTEKE